MSGRVRTTADEDADRQELLCNLASYAFAKWPIGAGLDGLCEKRGPIEIPVTGTIPAWTAGNLYRTGPGQSKVEHTPSGTHHFSHWFDGLAHSHRFQLVPDGPTAARVVYSSRRQSERLALHIEEQGAAGLFSFGQRRDPSVGVLSHFVSTLRAAVQREVSPMPDLDNVGVVLFPDMPTGRLHSALSGPPDPDQTRADLPRNLWTLTDAEIMREVHPATLEPIGHAVQRQLHPDLKGPFSTAHAQRDPLTGALYNFNLELGPTPTYRVFCVSPGPAGQTDILATLRCTDSLRPAYIHSFFQTEHYVVLCIPCSHVAHNGLRVLWERNIADGIAPFDAASRTRWLVIAKNTDRNRKENLRGLVAEFESAPSFFFHTVNAYETDAGLLCDLVDYPTFDIVRALYYDVLLDRDNAAKNLYSDPDLAMRVLPSLSRYLLPIPIALASSSSSADITPARHLWSIAAPHAGDLPTIHPGYSTKPHRYVYSICSRGYSTLADTLVKVDTDTQSSLCWDAPAGNVPGEPIFVPRPGDNTDEDDGVLLSVVLDVSVAKSFLLCLNARSMTEMGRADVGFAIGFGFHGVHVNKSL